MIEKIPFLHHKKMYNIVIEDDITFTALHYILDDLIVQGAFAVEEGTAELYHVVHEDTPYTIGVDGIDVFITVK